MIDLVVDRFLSMFKKPGCDHIGRTMVVLQVLGDLTLWYCPIVGLVTPNREIGPATARQVSRLGVTSPAIVQVVRFVVKTHDGRASSLHFQRLILGGIYRGLVGDRSYCVTT